MRLASTAVAAATVVALAPAGASPAHGAGAVVARASTITAPSASAAALPSRVASTLPTRVRGVGSARQLIVVTDPRRTSFTTLTAYEKDRLGWRVVAGPITARIGYNGFHAGTTRRQGSLTTPVGTYRLGPSFGNGGSPGTRMPYRVVDADDRWVYDPGNPATYNTYQPSSWGTWSSRWTEKLQQMGAQYRYVVSIAYNRPVMSMSRTARPHAAPGVRLHGGGGIFLHVNGTKLGGATAGCVSVPRASMRALLRWLDPTKTPVIAMGARAAILLPPAGASRTATVRAAVLPAVASVARTAATTIRVGTSRGGRAITAIRLGPAAAPRRLVVVGVIHGSEPAGSRVVARLRTLPLPAGLAVWLVPAMNPDGLAAGRRTNNARVDLNRNFPWGWRFADRGGPNYSGPRASSEPETRAMMSFLSTVNPGLVVIFHQPLDGVDLYGAKSRATVRALARATRFPVGWFDCHGGCHGTLTQWFNHTHRGQSITIEFPAGRPTAARVDRIARGVVAVAASSLVVRTG